MYSTWVEGAALHQWQQQNSNETLNRHFYDNVGVWLQKKNKYRREGKCRRCCLGTELNRFLAALDIFHQDDFEEMMNRIKATWRNGCLEKLDDHPLHTIPNHAPSYQNGCSPKHFCPITSPKEQRRPLPSLLLYTSFFY